MSKNLIFRKREQSIVQIPSQVLTLSHLGDLIHSEPGEGGFITLLSLFKLNQI